MVAGDTGPPESSAPFSTGSHTGRPLVSVTTQIPYGYVRVDSTAATAN